MMAERVPDAQARRRREDRPSRVSRGARHLRAALRASTIAEVGVRRGRPRRSRSARRRHRQTRPRRAGAVAQLLRRRRGLRRHRRRSRTRRARCWSSPSPRPSRSASCSRPREADIVSMEAQSFGVAAQLRRPVRRRHRGAEKYRPPDARPPRRRDRRQAMARAASS